MRLAVYFLSLLTALTVGKANAQTTPAQIFKQIDTGLAKYIITAKFKPSVAVYAGAIKINLSYNGKKAPAVTVETNASFLDSILDMDYIGFLKSIDYAAISKDRKRLSLIVPIACFTTVYHLKENPSRLVPLHSIPEKFRDFMYETDDWISPMERIYLKPIYIIMDKSTYD